MRQLFSNANTQVQPRASQNATGAVSNVNDAHAHMRKPPGRSAPAPLLHADLADLAFAASVGLDVPRERIARVDPAAVKHHVPAPAVA
jgi:hypothetical protein